MYKMFEFVALAWPVLLAFLGFSIQSPEPSQAVLIPQNPLPGPPLPGPLPPLTGPPIVDHTTHMPFTPRSAQSITPKALYQNIPDANFQCHAATVGVHLCELFDILGQSPMLLPLKPLLPRLPKPSPPNLYHPPLRPPQTPSQPTPQHISRTMTFLLWGCAGCHAGSDPLLHSDGCLGVLCPPGLQPCHAQEGHLTALAPPRC